jgi:putative addiction module killer protein
VRDKTIYETASGERPFQEWIEALDETVRRRVFISIDRVATGAGKKSIKPVGRGVFEIKVDIGPGYRVYFGEVGSVIILLLLGGDKSSQKRDIRKAIEYWENYAQS